MNKEKTLMNDELEIAVIATSSFFLYGVRVVPKPSECFGADYTFVIRDFHMFISW